MKIKRQDYNMMKEMILSHNTPERIREMQEEYKKAGASDVRFRWDLWNRVVGSLHLVCSVLYEYLNDDHIDSALKHIINEVTKE